MLGVCVKFLGGRKEAIRNRANKNTKRAFARWESRLSKNFTHTLMLAFSRDNAVGLSAKNYHARKDFLDAAERELSQEKNPRSATFVRVR